MISFTIGLAVGFPLLVLVSLTTIRRLQRRTAVRQAAEILGLQIDERGLWLPHLAGEVDGVDVRVEKSTRDWAAVGRGFVGLLFDNAMRQSSVTRTHTSTKTYTAPYGPITVITSPYGLPPEVEVEPSKRRRLGPIEHDQHSVAANFEDTFDVQASREAYENAILDNEPVMRALWTMHKQYRSVRCRNGEVHVQIDPMRTGSEIAGDVRSLVELTHDIERVFEEEPVRV